MHCNPRTRARATPRRRGLGLIELLVSLAISAALLTAVAVATDTSFRAYAINEEQSHLNQRGRLALNRILTYIRTCKEHSPITSARVADFETGLIVTDSGIEMFTEGGGTLKFRYDGPNKRLLMDDGTTSHVLLHGVEAFQVKLEPMQSTTALKTGGGHDLLKRATVLITVRTAGNLADIDESSNGQTVTLSSSVIPRRNAW